MFANGIKIKCTRNIFSHHFNKLLLLILIITLSLHFIIISLNSYFNYDSVLNFHSNNIKHTIFNIPSYTENIELYYKKIPGLIYNTENDNLKVLQNQRDGYIHKITFYKLGDLLSSWNPLEMSPIKWIESKCHPNHQKINRNKYDTKLIQSDNIMRFDYMKELSLALEYRQQELPFIFYNIPQLNRGIHINFTLHELIKNIGISKEILIENSQNNQFMYFLMKKSNDFIKARYPDWVPPQDNVKSTFYNFLKYLEESETYFSKSPLNNNTIINQNQSFKYLSLFYSEISMDSVDSWLKYSLPMLTFNSSLLQFHDKTNISDNVTVTSKQVNSYPYRGIVCRFGMRGMTNAAHFDSKRNFVAIIRGRRRYILLPPSECEGLQLYPKSHPSARHSSFDWTNITSIKINPKLYNSKAIETIVSMGEILFIPSYWFHYIVTQDAVIQCNARTSESVIGRDILREKCGFSQNKYKSKLTSQ